MPGARPRVDPTRSTPPTRVTGSPAARGHLLGKLPWTPLGKSRFIGRVETGHVYEQEVDLRHPSIGEIKRLRRVTVKLKKPTRDGDMEIHLLTNLPASRVSAVKVAFLYQKR
jgi:hypothetical protein